MGFFKELFSKENFSRTRINVEVITGHPQNVRFCNITNGDNPGEVFIELSVKNKTAYRPIGIDWEESATRNAGKAAGGAIIGTVVAGPLGTIAGAAVGGRKRDKSKAYIYLEDIETGEEVTLFIHCDITKYQQISTLLKR